MSDFEKARRYKRMAAALGGLLFDHDHSIDDFFRASGECKCDHCGLEFRDHPNPYQTCPTLHVLCDGRRVKL